MKMKSITQSFCSLIALLTLITFPLHAAASNMRGDVNDDGHVDINDVTEIINHILTGDATSINLTNADVTGEGDIDIDDVTLLINYVLTGAWPDAPVEGQSFTVNGVTFVMVPVEGGSFMMGATAEQGSDASSREKPVHQVTLSSYAIGQTEVTQELWSAVMDNNPSYFAGGQLPVERVSWEDCQAFSAAMNAMTGQNFRLPTESL